VERPFLAKVSSSASTQSTVIDRREEKTRQLYRSHAPWAVMFDRGYFFDAYRQSIICDLRVDILVDENGICLRQTLFQEQSRISRTIGSSASERMEACLQSIAAGDFLSPAILGLAFRDPWSGMIELAKGFGVEGDDRAVLLERAFEARYARLLAEPASLSSRLGAMTGDDPELATRHGLARPLGYIGDGERWKPLLLLNTTSVDTGRRLIASELAPSYRIQGNDRRVFPEAYDLFEMLPHADRFDIPRVSTGE
jgi:hypothetical protein